MPPHDPRIQRQVAAGMILPFLRGAFKFFAAALADEAAERAAKYLIDWASQAGMTIWEFVNKNPDAVAKAMALALAENAIETVNQFE